jgi:aerobic carbon-monoxide dehydrogenase medium subunit
MKACDFDYVRPTSVGEAIAALAAGGGDAKALAGGQSLGPMLNLRVAQPSLLVDVRRLDELRGVTETADAITYGAGITHAQFEDRAVPDATCASRPRVAADIAYRAVRNRGTLGGSLCHADPAADWVNTFALLPATAIIAGPKARREVPMQSFVKGLFETAVGADELLVGVRVAKLAARARWSYWKFCRKTGEFAEAIGAVLVDPDRKICRAVIGATESTPYLIEDARELAERYSREAALPHVERAVGTDPYERQVHLVALERAIRGLPQ